MGSKRMNEQRLKALFPSASRDFLAENHADAPLSHPEPQCDKAPALGGAVSGKATRMGRIRVSFTLYRVRLLDPDNAAGSVKDVLDGIRRATLIPGDEWHAIKLEVEQEQVGSYSKEKTVVTIQ